MQHGLFFCPRRSLQTRFPALPDSPLLSSGRSFNTPSSTISSFLFILPSSRTSFTLRVTNAFCLFSQTLLSFECFLLVRLRCSSCGSYSFSQVSNEVAQPCYLPEMDLSFIVAVNISAFRSIPIKNMDTTVY